MYGYFVVVVYLFVLYIHVYDHLLELWSIIEPRKANVGILRFMVCILMP